MFKFTQQLSDRIWTRIQFLFPNIPLFWLIMLYIVGMHYFASLLSWRSFQWLTLGKNFHGSASVNVPIELSLNILIPQVVLVNSFAFKRTLKTGKGCRRVGAQTSFLRLIDFLRKLCKATLYFLKAHFRRALWDQNGHFEWRKGFKHGWKCS